MIYNYGMYKNDFACIIGKVNELIYETEEYKIYEVSQYIKTTSELPRAPRIRVMVDITLKEKSIYVISGIIDSVKLFDRIVPVISVGRITLVQKSRKLFNDSTRSLTAPKVKSKDTRNKMLNSNFFYMTDFEVINKYETKDSKLLHLKRMSSDSKIIHIINVVCLCQYESEEQFKEVSIGDNISILGYINRDTWRDEEETTYELGCRIISINPDFLTVNHQRTLIEELHKKRYEPSVVEELMEYVK